MSGMTLFDIGQDLIALEQLLSETEGELTDQEMEQAIDTWLAENKQNQVTKFSSYISLVKEFKARANARKQESVRLMKRAAQDDAVADKLVERMRQFFDQHGIKKVETPRGTIILKGNGGLKPLEVTVDAKFLPDEYRIEEVVYKANNKRIREDLEIGTKLEWAVLKERGNHIEIK